MSKIEPLEPKDLRISEHANIVLATKFNEIIIKLNNHEDILSGLVEEVSTQEEITGYACKYQPEFFDGKRAKTKEEFGRDIHRHNFIIQAGFNDTPGLACECGVFRAEDTNKDSEAHRFAPEINPAYSNAVEQAVKQERERAIKGIEDMFNGVWGSDAVSALGHAIEIVRGQDEGEQS